MSLTFQLLSIESCVTVDHIEGGRLACDRNIDWLTRDTGTSLLPCLCMGALAVQNGRVCVNVPSGNSVKALTLPAIAIAYTPARCAAKLSY